MGKNESIESFSKLCKQFLVHFKQPRYHSLNLSELELQALHDLKNNKNIVIKHADKGSAIVIQNSDDYRKEALRQLHDERFYIGTNVDLTEKHQNMVLTLLKNLHAKGEITDKIYNGLIPYKIRTARFY